jgi:hypothetical protein
VGELGCIFGGVPSLATPIPGIVDPLYIVPGTEFLVAANILYGPNGTLAGGVSIPAALSLLGAHLTWQGVAYDAASDSLSLSNPTEYVFR